MTFEAAVLQYNGVVQEVAKHWILDGYSVKLADHWQSSDSATSEGENQCLPHLLEDGVHLSELGHARYHGTVLSVIEPILTDLCPKPDKVL